MPSKSLLLACSQTTDSLPLKVYLDSCQLDVICLLSIICGDFFWHPIASIVIIHPAISSNSSNWIAVISFDLNLLGVDLNQAMYLPKRWRHECFLPALAVKRLAHCFPIYRYHLNTHCFSNCLYPSLKALLKCLGLVWQKLSQLCHG